MSRLIKQILVIVLGGWLLWSPALVSAHATPTQSSPQHQQILATSPDQVSITYSERVEKQVSLIRVFDAQGNRVDQQNSQVDDQNPRLFSVDLPPDLDPGAYTVAWQLVSADDGHFSKGAFNFGIGQVSTASLAATNQLQIQHLTTLPETITIFIELLGQALLVGVISLILAAGAKAKTLPQQLAKLIILGSCLVLIGSLTHLVLKTFDLQQLLLTPFIPTLSQYLQTKVGLFTLVRSILSLLVLASLLVHGRLRIWLQTGLVLSLLLIRAYVSHAAASLFYPLLGVGITMAHLWAKLAWIGAVLVLVLMPTLRAKLIKQLRLLTILALVIGGMTGLYIIWLDLKSWDNLLTTEWGSRMLLLSLGAGWILVVRAFDWLLKKPLLLVEGFIGLGLLFLTSYLIITTPPLTLEKYAFSQAGSDQNVTVTLRANPHHSQQLLFETADTNLEKVALQLSQTEQNIGPLPIEPLQISQHQYALDTQLLTPPGPWQINLTADTLTGESISVPFSLEYPADIQTSKLDPSQRSWDSLTIASLAGAIGILLISIIGWQYYLHYRQYYRIKPDNQFLPLMSHQSLLELAACLVILLLSWLIHQSLLVTEFERQCRTDGNFWLQSTPLHNGQVVSPNTVTGCTLNVGLYHLTDLAQYQYFNQLKSAFAQLDFPDSASAGQPTEFSLNLFDDQQRPLSDLTIEHDRRLHLIVVGEDLATFAHIHSEDHPDYSAETISQGHYPFSFEFPRAGEYTLLSDFAVKGRAQSEQFTVTIDGPDRLESLDMTQLPLDQAQQIGDYTVNLTAPQLKANSNQYLEFSYHLHGQPVTDLQPYLAAAMHVAVISSDRTTSFHTHGEIWPIGSSYFQGLVRSYIAFHSHLVPNAFGPKIKVPVNFPRAGSYVIFTEVQHHDQVIVSRFAVTVE